MVIGWENVIGMEARGGQGPGSARLSTRNIAMIRFVPGDPLGILYRS